VEVIFDIFVFLYIVAGVNWSEDTFMLEQKGTSRGSDYPAAAVRTVPNGMKDFNQPVCDMLEKNANLCSVLNAPLPNSAIYVPTNRLPLANCHPFSASTVEGRMNSSSRLPATAQQLCHTFSNSAQAYHGIFSRPPVTSPGNRPVGRGYCESKIPVHGCRHVNGMPVSYAETLNGYCRNVAVPGMMVGQPVPCRSYGPMMHWSVSSTASSVNCDSVCKVNGVADITTTLEPRTNTSNANLQFSTVVVSAV